MLEYTTNTAIRDAMARAHVERGMVLQAMWKWLFQIRKPVAGKTVAA